MRKQVVFLRTPKIDTDREVVTDPSTVDGWQIEES